MQHRVRYADFDMIRVIGRGDYGEVQLTRHKISRKVYAMKLLSKQVVIAEGGMVFYWKEREIMANANSQWIVQMHYCFHDQKFLYMAMDYMPGGDLATYMRRLKQNGQTMPVSAARFYCAEIVLALDCIHNMGFIYGDLEAANVMLDRQGHIKLVDFGTCLRMNKVRLPILVGSPDHMAPEVIDNNGSDGYYGVESDWWSLGVLLYQLLVGELPFHARDRNKIFCSIENFMSKKKPLQIPARVKNRDAKNFIWALLCERTERLANSTQIKSHPFLKSEKFNFTNIRQTVPPYVPKFKDEEDTGHFNRIAEEDLPHAEVKTYSGRHEPFIGFTYNKALNQLLTPAGRGASQNVYSKMFWRSKTSSEDGSMTVETFRKDPHPDPLTEAARFLKEIGWDGKEITDLLMVADMMAATKPKEVEDPRTAEELDAIKHPRIGEEHSAILHPNEKIKKMEEEILQLSSAAAADLARAENEKSSKQQVIAKIKEVNDQLKGSKQEVVLQLKEVTDQLNAATFENLERKENERKNQENVMKRLEGEMANAAAFSSESAMEKESLQEQIKLLEKRVKEKSQASKQKDEEIRALTDIGEELRQRADNETKEMSWMNKSIVWMTKAAYYLLILLLLVACVVGFATAVYNALPSGAYDKVFNQPQPLTWERYFSWQPKPQPTLFECFFGLKPVPTYFEILFSRFKPEPQTILECLFG